MANFEQEARSSKHDQPHLPGAWENEWNQSNQECLKWAYEPRLTKDFRYCPTKPEWLSDKIESLVKPPSSADKFLPRLELK
jgi:hypothetical protein